LVAVAIGVAGSLYLEQIAVLARQQIEQVAADRLSAGQPGVAQHFSRANTTAIAIAKLVATSDSIGQSADDRGRPTNEALEAALAALHRAQPLDAERPALLVLLGGGASGRYRLGQSNRVDPDEGPYAALGEPASAHAVVASIEGQMYRVAVAPFVDARSSTGRGALGLGYPIDDNFAKTLAAGSGLEVIVLSGDKVVGSSLSPVERGDLPTRGLGKDVFGFGDLTGDHFVFTELFPQLTRHLTLPVGPRGFRYGGRALPLSTLMESGEKGTERAAPADAAVIVAVRTVDGYALLADQQREFLIGLAFLILLVLVLAATLGNPVKGLDRVAVAAEKMVLEGGDVRAPTDHMSRIARRLAIAVNTLAGRLEATPAPTPLPTASRTVSQELAAATSARPPEPAPVATASPGPAASGAPVANPVTSDTDPFGRPLPRPSGRSFTTSWEAPEPPPSADATVIAPIPEALIRATTRQSSSSMPAASAPTATAASSSSTDATVVTRPPISTAPTAASGDDSHYQQIYKEFVTTRERCGEPADGLTFEKFAAKLKKNQEQLIAKYSCRSVRFQVYVKDGKAALKATPVK
jgi:hypothetical protein